MQYVQPIDPKANLLDCGGKASAVQFLLRQDALVPKSWVISWHAFCAANVDRAPVLERLRAQLKQKLDLSKSYAVRSSANIEDGKTHSFAGQFVSVLDVRGINALLHAIETVWASAKSEAVSVYAAQQGIDPASIRMAVLIQEMVTPRVSGVSFSRNPLTGLDETVVEAVEGSGEALLQGGVTPLRWVYKWGDLITHPKVEPIPRQVLEKVIAETKRLANAYGSPVDLEWVWNGTAVQWVQVRPISTLGQFNIYSNRIAREVLPGVIKPLVWSVNVPLVNSAWVDLIKEWIGPHDIMPDDLAKSFHYRAYFNMTTLGRVFTALGMPIETLELMMGLEGGREKPRFKPSRAMARHLPRLVRFLLHKLRFGREIERTLPEIEAAYRPLTATSLETMSEKALLAHIDALFVLTQRMAYFNVVGPLLMQVYNRRFQKQLQAVGIDYATFDLMHDEPEMANFDPGWHLDQLVEQWDALSVEQQSIASFAVEQGEPAPDSPFAREFAYFLDRFGHFSDSGNDFSAPQWRENVPLLLQMIIRHKRADGGVHKHNWRTAPLGRMQRWRLGPSYRRARRFRLYRERISYCYTRGYGLFRDSFLVLADRLVQRGAFSRRDDVFYMRWDEVSALVDGRLDIDAAKCIRERRSQLDAVRDAVLPDLIYGDEPPPLETTVASQIVYSGIPTSRGYYAGTACVIKSVTEFDKMASGAVLVIPYSDVSWTPLFAKAGAVVAEAGGMLSHSSIVAREYGIPAVVSVSHATHRFRDGDVLLIDGYKGIVMRQEETVDLSSAGGDREEEL